MVSDARAWADATEASLGNTLPLEEEDIKPIIHPIPTMSNKDTVDEVRDKLFALCRKS